jgi:hypothetical protein
VGLEKDYDLICPAGQGLALKACRNRPLIALASLYWPETYILKGCRITLVVKPFEKRPVSLSTKKSPGLCIVCSAIATTEALFKVENVTVVQRYCDKCLPKADYKIGAR